MSSWSRQWQPISSEDERTAMVFGFFKHAPAQVGLIPWLEGLLPDLHVTSGELDDRSFWPSMVDASARVVPDLCFLVGTKSGPHVVVIEAKRSFEEHTQRQLSGEVRAAASAYPGLPVVLVTVGSRMSLQDRGHDPSWADVVVHRVHASWPSIGRAIEAVAAPEWRSYALDICSRMRSLGMLNEPGRPEVSTTPQMAFDAVNRLVLAARDLIRRVDDQVASPKGLSLPKGKIWRTGTSESGIASPVWLTQGVVYGSWSLPAWPEPRRVFVAIDLLDPDGPQILIGPAWAANGQLTRLMLEGDHDCPVRNVDLQRHAREFPHRKAQRFNVQARDFRFSRRPWSTEEGLESDLSWLSERFDRAVSVASEVSGEDTGHWVTDGDLATEGS